MILRVPDPSPDDIGRFGSVPICSANRPVMPILLFLRIGTVSPATEADQGSEWNRFQRRLLPFLLCQD
jgi:hypothetical protein